MNATLKSKGSEVLTKYNLSPEDARFRADVLHEIDDRQRSEFEAKLDQLLTKKDKTDLIFLMQQNKTELTDRAQKVEAPLTKQIYIVGLVQFLAIVEAVISIINFTLEVDCPG